jgi:hypothetical protein
MVLNVNGSKQKQTEPPKAEINHILNEPNVIETYRFKDYLELMRAETQNG